MIDAKVLGNVFSDVKLCIDVARDVSWVVITVIQVWKKGPARVFVPVGLLV